MGGKEKISDGIKIEAVTVCIDYASYLKETITHNKEFFDRWVVVTLPRDRETISLCEENDIEYVFSKRIYEDGAMFAKGKAVNEGLAHCDRDGWLVQLDADTRLLPGFAKALDRPLNTMAIYGLAGRYLIESKTKLKEFEELGSAGEISTDQMEHCRWLVGFFQMWHSNCIDKYSEQGTTAGLDDNLFLNYFGFHEFLHTFALHLGPMMINHDGIEAKEFTMGKWNDR